MANINLGQVVTKKEKENMLILWPNAIPYLSERVVTVLSLKSTPLL